MSQVMTILVTRPKYQADKLCQLIEQEGWQAIRFPTLEIIASNQGKIKQQIEQISQYDWVIFISANAVNFALSANDGKIEPFKSCQIVVVGAATKKVLDDVGLSTVLMPADNQFNTEGLLATEAMQSVKGLSCLVVRGDGGRELLADTLRERGARVEYLEVYTRVQPACKQQALTDNLQQGTLHFITITSGDGLKNLMAMVAVELHDKLLSVPLVVISDRIRRLAKKIGFKQVAVTKKSGDLAIIETVAEICAGAQI